MDKIEALKERLNQWIANAEENRMMNLENFIAGKITNVQHHAYRNFIDGQIDAYNETLKVL